MIISVSRRTDVPAFYSEWFINRIRKGYALVPNPFFPEKVTRVDLRPEAVDAIVFVTRNPGPLLPHLDELDRRGYRFCFQMTITGYPGVIEPHVISTEEAVSLFCSLSDRIGPDRVVWRFDPIVLSTLTPESFILGNFERIAGRLQDRTRRVIISFADYYQKVKTNFRQIHEKTGISFFDLHEEPERLSRIAGSLAEAARAHKLEIFSCAESSDFSSIGIQRGKCIDAEYLGRIFAMKIRSSKAGNQRKHCGCDHSQDIGRYDTCLHGCAYCYATKNFQTAQKNKSLHDPTSACLIGHSAPPEEKKQLCLF